MSAAPPHGAWPSPLTADLVVASSVGLGAPQLAMGQVWWSESRPHEAGRTQIVRRPVVGDARAVDVLPDGFGARSRAHEYGGGAWWVTDGALVFTNAEDQALWLLPLGPAGAPVGAPERCSPPPPVGTAHRYTDARPTGDPRWWVCVREVADTAGERDELVAVRVVPGDAARAPVALWSGADFVSNPRPGPGAEGGPAPLCWLSWDLPHMPWESTTLWVAGLDHDPADGAPRLADPEPVMGASVGGAVDGVGESLAQPGWLPDGRLAVVSDADNWWNLWVFPDPGRPAARTATQWTHVAGELAPPQWVFGQTTWAVTEGGDLVGSWRADGNDHLGVLPAGEDEIVWVHSGHTAVEGLATSGTTVALTAGSYASEPTVSVVGIDDLVAGARAGTHVAVDVRRPARVLGGGLGPAWWSWPEAISVPAEGGGRTHALVYRPINPDVPVAERGSRPPLLVLIHGGPTAAARPQLNLAVQFWTTRGWAVADVNYRGSVGFGRRYREQLAGGWGVVDVADCVSVARHLADEGVVDAGRMAIRGGSAGGFTTLAALVSSDVFSAGVSLYGIADLELLAAETHRFESGYNDWLLGPLATAADVWADRSPINHVGRITSPLLVLHGAEDAVVPPSQAELIVAALRERGVPVGYLLFEGEQHGFRQADTLLQALRAEAFFLGTVLGLPGADADVHGGAGPPVVIDNLAGIDPQR